MMVRHDHIYITQYQSLGQGQDHTVENATSV